MLHHSYSDAAPNPVAVATAPRLDPRRRLLNAMIQTVSARGYDRTTVSRVLANADVPEAVFSEHFHDKQDCFMQALDQMLGDVERGAVKLFEQGEDAWPQCVASGLNCLLELLVRNPDGARVALVEVFSVGVEACERQRRTLALFTSLMERGHSCATSPLQLPTYMSEAVVGGVVSIVHRRVLQGETAELTALRADLTYFALLPYLDHERALAVATSTA